VIGPGNAPVEGSLTTTEQEKLNDLILESFIYDVLLVVMMDLTGYTSHVGGLIFTHTTGIAENSFPSFYPLAENIISNNQAIDDAIYGGDFLTALNLFFKELEMNYSTNPDYQKLIIAFYQDIDKVFQESYGFGVFTQTQEIIEGSQEIITAIIEGTGSLAGNINAVIGWIEQSNKLDIWEVKVSKSKVKINPVESSLVSFVEASYNVDVDAELQDGEFIEYEYSCTANYGLIWTQGGTPSAETGPVTDSTIIYKSTALEGELGDSNIEEITVTAFVVNGNERLNIGSATATVQVLPLQNVIHPDIG